MLPEPARLPGVGVVATNNVHYATREDFPAHDILRCVATKTLREEPHPDKPLNAERYLKSGREMAELFLSRGADPSMLTDEGKAAADIAAAQGHIEIAAMLRAVAAG